MPLDRRGRHPPCTLPELRFGGLTAACVTLEADTAALAGTVCSPLVTAIPSLRDDFNSHSANTVATVANAKCTVANAIAFAERARDPAIDHGAGIAK